ncbi:uncharacterized protein LOC144445309 isoform X2 [Glandiceps talaboti]
MQDQSEELLQIRETQRAALRENLDKHEQARSEIFNLRKSNQVLEQEKIMMGDELKKLTAEDVQKFDELQSDVTKLESIKKELHTKNLKLERTVEHLTEELKDTKQQLEDRDHALRQSAIGHSQGLEDSRYSKDRFTESELLQSRNSDQGSEVELYKSQVIQLMNDCKEVQEIKSQLNADNEELMVQVEKLEDALKKSKEELQRVQQSAHRLSLEKQDLLALNNELQSKMSEYQSSGMLSGSPPESGLHNFKELELSVNKQLQEEYLMVERDGRQKALLPDDMVERKSDQSSGSDTITVAPQAMEAKYEKRDRSSSDTASKKLSKSEHTVHDLLVQLQSEREKVAEFMHLHQEEQNKRLQLEQNLFETQQKLKSSSSDHNTVVSHIKQEHQDALNNLVRKLDSMSAQLKATQDKQDDLSVQSTGEDIQGLKSQVMSLLSELKDTEDKLKEAKERITNYRHRYTEVERQQLILQDEFEERCKKDGTIIDTMRVEIQNYDDALKAERLSLQQQRLNMQEIESSHGRLAAEYELLWKMYNELREKGGQGGADPRAVQEKDARIDNLTAQLVSADEAIAAKEDEIKELRKKAMELQGELETVPVLKAQADIYQADFQAEREAREKAHGEREALMQEIQQLQLENQQLQDDLNTYTNTQIVEMQKRHGKQPDRRQQGGAAGYSQPGRGYPYPGGHYYPDGEAGALRVKREPVETHPPGVADGMGHHDNRRETPVLLARGENAGVQVAGTDRPASPVGQLTCPKCEQHYPDMDTLQIHILDCID